MHIINAGSVGKPKDGDSRACYCILTITASEGNFKKIGIGVEFVRIGYNIERALAAMGESILPPVLSNQLLKGY